jgi:hypothetical protein
METIHPTTCWILEKAGQVSNSGGLSEGLIFLSR